MANKTKQIIVAVSPELKRAVFEVAVKHDITVTKLVLTAVAKQYPELVDYVLGS